MTQVRDEKQDILRKYLLHDLADSEEEQIECSLLTDKDFSRRLAIAQDDLIDDFISERLTKHEVERFHDHFLTTSERVQKVNFATALNKYVVDKTPPPTKVGALEEVLAFFRTYPLKTAFSIALLLIVSASLLIVFRTDWLQFGQNQFQQEFVRINRAQESDHRSLFELKRSTANTLAMILRDNLVREDGDSQEVELTGGVTQVRLIMEVTSGSYDRYNAILQKADGENLASVEGLKARNDDGAEFVIVIVPSGFLAPGDYQLRLLGIDSTGRSSDLGLYPFQMTTK
jgi:hypothetical protein